LASERIQHESAIFISANQREKNKKHMLICEKKKFTQILADLTSADSRRLKCRFNLRRLKCRFLASERILRKSATFICANQREKNKKHMLMCEKKKFTQIHADLSAAESHRLKRRFLASERILRESATFICANQREKNKKHMLICVKK
jgi:hypothetical protein